MCYSTAKQFLLPRCSVACAREALFRVASFSGSCICSLRSSWRVGVSLCVNAYALPYYSPFHSLQLVRGRRVRQTKGRRVRFLRKMRRSIMTTTHICHPGCSGIRRQWTQWRRQPLPRLTHRSSTGTRNEGGTAIRGWRSSTNSAPDAPAPERPAVQG